MSEVNVAWRLIPVMGAGLDQVSPFHLLAGGSGSPVGAAGTLEVQGSSGDSMLPSGGSGGVVSSDGQIVMAVTETRVSRAHDTLTSGNFRDKVVLPRWKVNNWRKGDGIQ